MARNTVFHVSGVPTEPPPSSEIPLATAHRDVVDTLGRDERHRQFGALLEFSPDAIVIVDADGLVRECNPAAQLMLQTEVASEIRAPLRDLLCGPHREAFDEAWVQLVAGRSVAKLTARPDPDSRFGQPLDLTLASIRSDDTLVGAVVILRGEPGHVSIEPAILALTEAPTQTHALSAPLGAEFDGPAGLPGRRWLQRRLSGPRAEGPERAVAIFDVDGFAMVMTTYGPDAAAAVLTQFGELLKSLDTPGVFAHFEADTFVWTVDTVDPVAALDKCVASLAKALKEPLQVGADRGWLTLKMGLATTSLVGRGDVLAAARDALHSAKQSGRPNAVYYDRSMKARATSSFKLASDLHHAIEHDDLRLHYQPIMDFATNEIAGVEALVRWERPGAGLLAPGEFIDAAERTGQIIPLGNWVVRTACNNALKLGSHSGGPRTMSINVSASQLRDPDLITTLRDAMVEGNCAPSTIVIEVTESVILHDLKTVAASLKAIKALDVGLDLDDFGTGYSSLQYLRDLPIDRLKVDQGFVAGLGVNGADTAIVASTIALAHALGLRSIAEGVETTEQLALLREMGCDFAQGYLLSRPADMESFTTWLDAYVPAEVFPQASATAARLSNQRGDDADGRDKRAYRRDVKFASRETKANTRDTTATDRDTEANTRDAEANTRDTTATDRDTEANTRELTADGREKMANERERAADLRDIAASEREHIEDEREVASGSAGSSRSARDASSARHTAEEDRVRATAERKAEASDRTLAGKGRDDASAGRTIEAASRAEDKTPPPSKDDGV